MKPLPDLFGSACWWLVQRVAAFSTRNMYPGISRFIPMAKTIPDFGPRSYENLHGSTSGGWRFRLVTDLRVDLARILGLPPEIEFCDPSEITCFADGGGKIWATLSHDGLLEIRRDYVWNGCSPKWWALGRWWGTPDPEWSRLASLVHDVLYQFGKTDHFPFSRDQCDLVFYNIMVACSANPHLAGTYYGAVCKVGCRFFKKNDCYSFTCPIINTP